jgi:hypothetical protein
MLELLLAGFLIGAPFAAKDTVIQVGEGDRLLLRDFSGLVEVEGWDRDELRAEADAEEAIVFRFTRSGSAIEMEALDRKNRSRSEDLRLRVPAWMDVEISGPKLDVEISRLTGVVTVRNLKGDIYLEDLSGRVNAGSVEGSIYADGLRGSARLRTGDDEIRVVDSSADLDLESVSGDIELEEISGLDLKVRSTHGEVDFFGSLLQGGSYAFHTHSGDLTLVLDPDVDADVTVLAYEGEFEADFPIRSRGFRSGHEFGFTIGSGGAQLLLEAFDGEISLRRRDLHNGEGTDAAGLSKRNAISD